jgi:Tfp pilus assembly protein PilF
MRLPRWGLWGLLCLLLLAAPARADLREDVAAAVAARDRHDYASATKILTTIIRQAKLPKPALGEVYGIRGVFWQEQREYYRAISDFTRATQLAPLLGEPHNNLAWILATCDDPDFRNAELALKHATEAAELRKGSPDSLDTLAAAQAEAGRFPEAVATMERVVAWCEQKGDAPRLEQARLHLASYREGKPWRDEVRRR